MNLFKNFIHIFRRYTVATILNLVGMSVAFASFTLIMMQVGYDLTYDRQYENADRMFRIEMNSMVEDAAAFTPLLFNKLSTAEQIVAVSPDIEKSGGRKWFADNVYDAGQQRFSMEGSECCIVSESWFDLFGFRCISGSLDRIAEPDAIAISEKLAGRIFPGRSPIGETLFAEDSEKPLHIVAVYKDFPKNSTVKNGIYLTHPSEPNRSSCTYYIVANQAGDKKRIETELTRKLREIAADTTARIRLTSLHDVHFSTDCAMDSATEKCSRATVFSLAAIAVLILAIAMINSVNFAIALVPIRIRSLNARRVFGCRISELRMELLAENIGMTALAFLLALSGIYALAPWAASVIGGDVSLPANRGVVGFSAAVALASGILAGLYPAFYSTSFNPAFAVKGDFSNSHAGKRLRMLLVAVQFIISIALIATTLFIRQQNRFLLSHNPGFQRQNILTTTISWKTAEQADTYAQQLNSYPGIEDVAFGFQSLVSPSPGMNMAPTYKGKDIELYPYPVSANFIAFMGLEIVEGRDTDESDRLKENNVVIFNQTAQKKFDIETGTRIGGLTDDNEIIGIVRDFNFQPLYYPVYPMVFYIFGENPPFPLQTVFVKVNGKNLAAAIEHIRKTGIAFDPQNNGQDIVFMDQAIGNLYQKERHFSKLITLFSLLSVLISVIGVFGLVLFEIQHRKKEIGLRKVHGATIGEILRMLNKTYVRIVLACSAIAIPIAYFAIRKWLEQFTYKAPVGIGIFLAALLIVLLVVVATITIQSYKTASANPVDAIKKE